MGTQEHTGDPAAAWRQLVSSGADLQKAKGQPSVAYRPPARSPEWGKTPSGPFTAPPSHSPYYSEASNHMSPQALVQIIGKGN